MQISLQFRLLLSPSIMFKTTCAKYSKKVATRPLPVYFSRACILHSSHALQNVLYTAWTLLTFHILLLIYIDLCTCKLLETLQLKNKREIINTLVAYRIFFTDRTCYLSMESTDIKNGLDTLYLYYYNTICEVIKRSTSKLSLTSKGLLKY